ncbi:U32 family peptidase [uncultured Clostridium sp.]|uniref:U32 family peptidase n=1 Tax=uncultured Clostridium sp. TaxID=59620 RepID=UPI0025D8A4EE|nr:DUF3656 domain-containing protein [uncultured Clostridium sp.]
MKKKVEILAPAGSFDSMKAAVAAGADAVYMGGSRFGARAYAENPDEMGMLEAINYVHLHGRQLYMTVNTLVKEDEMDDLYDYLLPYYQAGLDAVIVQDMGVFSYIREHFPDLPVHASTQMTITGPEGAALMTRMGAVRIVTARELSLDEIRRIYQETGVEIESFVHGALCYCYSGQCLFSSLIGGRSGNRGRCAQTCRLPFDILRRLDENNPNENRNKKKENGVLNPGDSKYVLSLKDLCTLDILPDILEAGVYSLKIEGRMKSPRYTAGVVRLYRKYVDLYLKNGRKGYRVDPKDRKELLDLFDRGGQTLGYYTEHNGRDMVVCHEKPAFRQENRELYQYLDKTYVEAEVKEPVQGFARVCEGEPLQLTLQYEDPLTGESRMAGGIGAVVQTAVKQPMSKERIEKQLGKTGNTPYYFENLEVETGGSPFVPVQELNELRRSAFEQLTGEILRPYRREMPENKACETGKGRQNLEDENNIGNKTALYHIHVSVEHPAQLKAALSVPEVGAIYLDSAEFGAEQWNEWVSRCHEADKQCLLVMPHIFRDRAKEYFETHRSRLESAGFDGLVIRAWEELELVREWKISIPLVMDYGIYTMNHRAEDFVREMAPELPMRFTLPVELNSRELEARGSRERELLVYGSVPVMVTAQCIRKTVEGCSKCPEYLYLRDRKKKVFPVRNQCRFCCNTIYNSSPLSLLKDKKQIDRLQPEVLRLAFTSESAAQTGEVLDAYVKTFLYQEPVELEGEFTRGHFKRGVE